MDYLQAKIYILKINGLPTDKVGSFRGNLLQRTKDK